MTTKTTTIGIPPAIAPEFVEAMAQHTAQALIDFLSDGDSDALTALNGLIVLHDYVDAFKAGTLTSHDEESLLATIPDLTNALTALGMDWRTPGGSVEPGSVRPHPKKIILKTADGEPVDQEQVRRMIAKANGKRGK